MAPSKIIGSEIRKMDNETSYQQSTQLTFQQNQLTPDQSQVSSRFSSRLQQPNDEMTQFILKLQKMKLQGLVKESIKEEEHFVTSLINFSNREDYILQIKWAQEYTDYLQTQKQQIGPIDNRILLVNQNIQQDETLIIPGLQNSYMKKGLEQEKHFVILNEKVWRFINQMYGGGPTLKYENGIVKNFSSLSSIQNDLDTQTQKIQIKSFSQNNEQNQDELKSSTTKPPRPANTPASIKPPVQPVYVKENQTKDNNEQAKLNRFEKSFQEKQQRLKSSEKRERDRMPIKDYLMQEEQRKEQEYRERLESNRKQQQEEETRLQRSEDEEKKKLIDEQREQAEKEVKKQREFEVKRNESEFPGNDKRNKSISQPPRQAVKTDSMMASQIQIPKLWDMEQKDIPLVGLQNQRFYCYMNSALQCLLSVSQLNAFFLGDKHNNMKGQKKKQYLLIYKDLIQSITKMPSNIPVLNANQLQRKTDQLFSSYEQHDSHEFLLHLLGEIKEEMYPKLQLPETKTQQEAIDQYFKTFNNTIDHIFCGMIKSSIQCPKCKQCSIRCDPVYDLSLPIKPSRFGETTLYDCLNHYFEEDTLDDAWLCEMCKKRPQKAKRQLHLCHLPNILIVHFKRFTVFPRKEKLKEGIAFPAELDMKKYSASELSSDSKYSLKAIIVHEGSLNGGHYFAYSKRKNNWYCFNDSEVEKVSESDALKQKQAYVLFYERVSRA